MISKKWKSPAKSDFKSKHGHRIYIDEQTYVTHSYHNPKSYKCKPAMNSHTAGQLWRLLLNLKKHIQHVLMVGFARQLHCIASGEVAWTFAGCQ